MLIKRRDDIKPSEITDRRDYINRRRLILAGVGTAVAAGSGGLLFAASRVASKEGGQRPAPVYAGLPRHAASTDESPTEYADATTYTNFYEFGTEKESAAREAHRLKTRPWSVTVEGECERPGVYDIGDLVKPQALEERIYRLRCVEAWSMVIPWVGFPLADALRRFEPGPSARHVAFTTLHDPEQMPGQRRSIVDWPYREGLRLDEAMHPLSLLAVGMYGEVLPNQNGAPLRLVVPWKYGFKSIKSIVGIRFTRERPATSWNMLQPREYGFYANVNPTVDHPRWSQARERRIGDGLLAPKRETLMFNGYADQVASLYGEMDLRRDY